MPIVLVEQTVASVPTPASGKVAIFVDSVTGEPYYKDDAGAATSLQGATGPAAPETLTIVTEASTSTMDPATHAGRSRYLRCAGNVTFNSAESYTAGEVYNIRATSALTLVGTGVTLTPPSGGTLAMSADMAVSVIMTSSTAGDVIGQTVPA